MDQCVPTSSGLDQGLVIRAKNFPKVYARWVLAGLSLRWMLGKTQAALLWFQSYSCWFDITLEFFKVSGILHIPSLGRSLKQQVSIWLENSRALLTLRWSWLQFRNCALVLVDLWLLHAMNQLKWSCAWLLPSYSSWAFAWISRKLGLL